MLTLLSRFFSHDQTDAPLLDHFYVLSCAVVGILLNLLLFAGKLAVGHTAHSVAISADAFNNLGDAGSGLLVLFGLWVSSFGAGREHPFGHGRIEWLIGLFTSLAVIFIGFEFARSSLLAIIHPVQTKQTFLTLTVLFLSILVKLFLYVLNARSGKKIGSQALKAAAIDCLSDCAATGAVLISALITLFSGRETDGWCGLAVSFLIIFAGYRAIKEVIERIIGTAPEQTLVDQISAIVSAYPLIHCVYDLTIHDYGYERFVISMRIAGGYDQRDALHTIADDIAYQIHTQLGCQCTVQTELLYADQSEADTLQRAVEKLLCTKAPQIQLQNFRLTQTEAHIDLIFELIMPSAQQEAGEAIKQEIIQLYPTYRIICQIILLHNHPMPSGLSYFHV